MTINEGCKMFGEHLMLVLSFTCTLLPICSLQFMADTGSSHTELSSNNIFPSLNKNKLENAFCIIKGP